MRLWSRVLPAVAISSFASWIAQSLAAQEPAFHSISGTVEVGTLAVAFSAPRVEILYQGRLATRENIALLANVKTICVLPYDGWRARNVVDNLPSLDLVRSGLDADKGLRQQRNEVSEELEWRGFQKSACLAGGEQPDAELLFTRVMGGFGDTSLPAYFWLLYAGNRHSIVVHGEKELMGLARPSYGWLPLTLSALADQVKAVTEVAKASLGTGRDHP